MQAALSPEFPPTIDEWLALLTNEKHLMRDGALRKLDRLVKDTNEDHSEKLTEVANRVLALLTGTEALPLGAGASADGPPALGLTWEAKQGLYEAVSRLLSWDKLKTLTQDTFTNKILKACQKDILDQEVRVRMSVGNALHGLATCEGVKVWEDMNTILLDNVRSNFERSPEPADAEEAGRGNPDGSMSPRGPISKGGSFPQGPILKDRPTDIPTNEGWKSLETSMRAMERIMSALGDDFAPYVTDDLIDLIASAYKHINRFVREIGYFTCAGLFGVRSEPACSKISKVFAPLLAHGLSDNWSQVRYAASVATKSFLEHGDETYFELLLPRMCLNRYYVAEGVRLYAQQTWREIVGMRGLDLVAKFIDKFVVYYVESSEADNHAVREAACRCIAELATKIEKSAVAPHVPVLIKTLITCFKDESWPVRDCACTATGSFVQSFPEESKPSLEELYELWISHLSDNIWSVRENAAISLGQVLKTYGDDALTRIRKVLADELPKALSQPEDSQLHSGLNNVTTFGVAEKKARDNDPHVHTGQQAFSCGSLAPKLRRGGGCMDHGFVRPRQPWESSDGCVYLIREVAETHPDVAAEQLTVLAEVASIRSFAHYHLMLETIFKQLPVIAKRIGNDLFAPHLTKFFGPLFGVLERNENRLAMSAAGYALFELRAQFGDAFTSGLDASQQTIMTSNEFVR